MRAGCVAAECPDSARSALDKTGWPRAGDLLLSRLPMSQKNESKKTSKFLLLLSILGGMIIGGGVGFSTGLTWRHRAPVTVPSLLPIGFTNLGLRAEPAATSPLFISLEGEAPVYLLDHQPLDIETLLEKVKSVNALEHGWPVILEASYDVPASKLLELHRLLSQVGVTIEETRVRTAPNQIGLPPAYFISRIPARETAFQAQTPAARSPENHPNNSASPFIANLPDVDEIELHWALGTTSAILATRKLTGDDAQVILQLWRHQNVGQNFIKASVPKPQIVPAISFYHQGKLVTRVIVDIGNSNQIDFLEPEAARPQHEGIDANSSEGIELMEAIKIRIGSLFPKAIQAASKKP